MSEICKEEAQKILFDKIAVIKEILTFTENEFGFITGASTAVNAERPSERPGSIGRLLDALEDIKETAINIKERALDIRGYL